MSLGFSDTNANPANLMRTIVPALIAIIPHFARCVVRYLALGVDRNCRARLSYRWF